MTTRLNLTHGTARIVSLTNRVTREPAGQITAYGGWQWVHGGNEYRTDAEGSGLFLRVADGWTQCRGTSQFHLPDNRAAVIRTLRRAGLTPDEAQS